VAYTSGSWDRVGDTPPTLELGRPAYPGMQTGREATNTGITGRQFQANDVMNGGANRTTQGGAGGDINQAGAASDPFAYTMGSLLTPWTKQFSYNAPAEAPESGGSGGGAPAAPPPSFSYPEFSYSFDNPGRYQSPQAFQAPAGNFSYGQFQAPSDFTGGRVSAPGDFKAAVSPYQQAQYQQPGAFQPTAGFTADRFTGPDAYKSRDKFVMGDITQDPSYQFRLQQGQQALENSASARGLLRSGGTMKDLIDYGQNAASQEYQNAYNRQFGAYQADVQNQQAAYDRQLQGSEASYDRNYQAGLTENQTAYNRAGSEYDRNAQMGAQAWDRNFNAGMAQNEQAYNRSASEYDRNFQNQMAVGQTNYQRGSSEYDRNYQNQLQRYQMGYQNASNEYDRNFQNAANVYQMNAQTGLNAYQANAQNAATMGRLGYDVAAGGYDRNFNAYQTAFGIDESRRQQAAALAASGAAQGRAGEAQAYNRAMQQYQMDYDIYNNNQSNQFNRLMTLANLGQNAAGAVGGYGSNYAANGGNAMMGAGNAQAAGIVGGANAWNQGIGQMVNTGMNAYGMSQLNQGAGQQPWNPSMGT
jgi:hypothetical protein